MKKVAVFLIFFTTTILLQAQTISWDIKFLKGKERESVPINQIIKMETGQNFLIAITPASDCYCYVVCQDSERQIVVLHAAQLKGGNELPLGPYQIEDPPGTETLYVIISQTRQTKLEELIQAQKNNPGARQQANNLYREVVSLQNTASGLGEPASSFVPSGGTSRGNTQENATRFSGKNLYVRAITIRH